MPHRTRIKICGITSMEAALHAADAGADALGFVFFAESKRAIGPDEAWEIVQRVPAFVSTVGLFVNADPEDFFEITEACPTDFAQFHGTESVATVRECGTRLIKAVRFSEKTIEADLQRWSALEEVDAILVDGSAGGQGTAFDWSKLAEVRSAAEKPLILAGGLTPENVEEAIRAVRPFAVDVSSGVESAPGVKDPARVEAFCAAVRRADSA